MGATHLESFMLWSSNPFCPSGFVFRFPAFEFLLPWGVETEAQSQTGLGKNSFKLIADNKCGEIWQSGSGV